MRFLFVLTIATLLLPARPAEAIDLTKIDQCDDAVQPRKKAKTHNKGMVFAMLIASLEEQGRGDLIPAYEPLTSQCLLSPFETKAGKVQAVFSPFAKGMQTLHYRFIMGVGNDEREFLVLYNGIASLIDGGSIFYVTETKKGTTRFYAAYKGQPRHKDLKKLIRKIAEGKTESLIEVDWPETSKEMLVHKYSSKKLH